MIRQKIQVTIDDKSNDRKTEDSKFTDIVVQVENTQDLGHQTPNCEVLGSIPAVPWRNSVVSMSKTH